ncbi:PD40 domain-containing protein [Demequina subtropica]|uniref:PD40 domain-containing protein n=1 Tax=Demequina subtropica TaxID=1638989 RepID=UPI000784CF9F|nr:PD40 domain-containing protein [Demequina subtropica]
MADEREGEAATAGARVPAALRSPRVWIPAAVAAVVLVVTLAVLLVLPAANDRAAAEAPRVSPSPTHVSPSPTPVPTTTPTPQPSDAATPAPSATPDAEAGVAPLDAAQASACVPDLALPVALQAATQVLPGDEGAVSADASVTPLAGSPSYRDVSFSADGSRIAVTESNDGASTFRLLDVSGTDSRLDLASEGEPRLAWNSTRRTLAVARKLDGGAVEVSTVDADSGEQTVVGLFAGAGAESVAWSADGACLAVAVRDAAAPGASEDPQAHTISTIRLSDGAVTAIDNGLMPVFAEDGTLIYRKVDGGRLELWSSSLDGMDQGVIGHGAGKLYTARTVVTPAVLSADRGALAYTEQSSPVAVRVVNPDGTHDALVATLDLPWARVRWMPDGVTLLVDDCDGSAAACEVWLVDSVSGAAEQVKVPHARGTGLSHPTPLPDGSGVVVMVDKPSADGQPATSWPVAVRDGKATKLTDPQPGSAASAPAWSPDGDRLLISLGPVSSGDHAVAGRFLVTRR